MIVCPCSWVFWCTVTSGSKTTSTPSQVVAGSVTVTPASIQPRSSRSRSAARAALRDRLLRGWMLAGVTVTDPATTWLGVDVVLEPDVTVHQNTQLHGHTIIRSGAVVGPNTTPVSYTH